MFAVPSVIKAEVFARVPDTLRAYETVRLQSGVATPLLSRRFFDRDGDLYMTNISLRPDLQGLARRRSNLDCKLRRQAQRPQDPQGWTHLHGMNERRWPDGEPRVIFPEDELNGRLGAGAVRVICPITNPFVRHHGALGSFVRVYARNDGEIPSMMAASAALPGVALVLDAADAAQRFELPLDREADFVVLGTTKPRRLAYRA